MGASPPSFAAGPEVDYALHCMGCHRQDGGGTEGKVPALKGSMGRFLSVPGGREFLVQVPGTSQSALSDAKSRGRIELDAPAIQPRPDSR